MFLRDLLRSIAIVAIICAPLAVPDGNPHEPPWWLAITLTAFWGFFDAMVICPAAREYTERWR